MTRRKIRRTDFHHNYCVLIQRTTASMNPTARMCVSFIKLNNANKLFWHRPTQDGHQDYAVISSPWSGAYRSSPHPRHQNDHLSFQSMNTPITAIIFLIDSQTCPSTCSSYCLSQPRQSPHWERAGDGTTQRYSACRGPLASDRPATANHPLLSAALWQAVISWLTERKRLTDWNTLRHIPCSWRQWSAWVWVLYSIPRLYLWLTIGVEDNGVLCEVLPVTDKEDDPDCWMEGEIWCFCVVCRLIDKRKKKTVQDGQDIQNSY